MGKQNQNTVILGKEGRVTVLQRLNFVIVIQRTVIRWT